MEMSMDENTIEVSGIQHKLSNLNQRDRQELMNQWQKENVGAQFEGLAPDSFLFAIQEPYWFKNKIGCLAKTGHTLLYDKTAKTGRAAL